MKAMGTQDRRRFRIAVNEVWRARNPARRRYGTVNTTENNRPYGLESS
jgi:hypothetical protein